MGSVRWTEAELASRLQAGSVRVAHAFGGTDHGLEVVVESTRVAVTQPTTRDLRSITLMDSKKPVSRARQRALDAAASVNSSAISGRFELGKRIELQFDGAKMLSTNDIYALGHMQRVAYRKAWHAAIEAALLTVLGPHPGARKAWKPLSLFKIQAHRRSGKLADTDALHSFFKFPVDGLRYARVILDDHPRFFASMVASQELGSPLMRIIVEAIDCDSPRACIAGTTAAD